MFSLKDVETRLEEALERNAMLECELEQKEELVEIIQKLREVLLKNDNLIFKRKVSIVHTAELIEMSQSINQSLLDNPVNCQNFLSTNNDMDRNNNYYMSEITLETANTPTINSAFMTDESNIYF
jgi:hypothetical protein